jgi:hypothetical protein
MLDIVPSSEELATVFAHAAAPAFLLAGVAAFISIVSVRITGVIDRLRNLSEIADDDPTRSGLKQNIPNLKRRAVLLHRAAHLALWAGIATSLLLMLSVATALLKLQHLFGGALLFGVATGLLTVALFSFAQEVRVALREVEQY